MSVDLQVRDPPVTLASAHVLREAWLGRHHLPRHVRGVARARIMGVARGCLVAGASVDLLRATRMPSTVIIAIARVGLHPDGGWACAWTEAQAILRAHWLPRRLRLPVLLRRRLGRHGLRHLLQVPDPEVLAWALQRTSSWGRVLGSVIDSNPDPKIGTLYACRVPHITAHLLVVQCPSTGLRHVLVVPPDAGNTAAEARRWTMHGIEPEIET